MELIVQSPACLAVCNNTLNPIMTTAGAHTTQTATARQIGVNAMGSINGSLIPLSSHSYSMEQPRMFTTFQFANPTSVMGMGMGGSNVPEPDPVYTMLQTINDKLTGIQMDLRILKDSRVSMNTEIQGIIHEQADHYDMIQDQKKDFCACQDQVNLLTDYVI